jgi:hypothetical protein
LKTIPCSKQISTEHLKNDKRLGMGSLALTMIYRCRGETPQPTPPPDRESLIPTSQIKIKKQTALVRRENLQIE